MKEQDYMNIMGAIRGEYLEEAVSWDGSQRRRIRQIRRMTVSFGAVAAALAVVIGMIAYKANKDKIETANSDMESSVIDDLEKQQNLFGGHGELRQLTGTEGTICYDDDFVYEGDYKWSVRSGGKVLVIGEDEKPANLFMDGKNLFRLHDNKIFETDSFGKETELIDLSAWQLPMTVEPERILGVRKLSDRMVCVDYDNGAQFCAKLIFDLQTKHAAEQTYASYPVLFPDTETGYYAVSEMSGIVMRYEMAADGTLTEKIVWESPQDYAGFFAYTVRDQKLYMAASRYDPAESWSDNDPAYLMTVDLSNGTMTESEIAEDSYVYAGTALYRGVLADGAYSIYKRAFDSEDEQRVFSVPVDQYFDTETYGMPKLSMSLYESADKLIVHLPKSVDTIPCPSRHGEDGALVDLKTGKVLFYGVNYSLSTPDDSSIAEVISTTVVSGTGSIQAETGTTVSGTTQNSTAAGGTTTTAAKNGNAARFTVADGSNIFGGEGYLYPQIGRFCMDGSGDLYEIGYSGTRLRLYSDQSLMFVDAGSVCRKDTCKHNDESCPLYHYNLNETRMNADGSPKDGVQVQLLDSTHVQRGTKVYTIDERTGAETVLFEISQVNGIRLGDGDLRIGALTKIGSADESAERYFVNISLSLDLAGVDPDSTYLMLVDAKRGTQKLIGRPGPEGIDENNISWGCMQQDYHDAVYAIQNQNTLIRVDAVTGAMTSYPLENGIDGVPLFNAWFVRDNKMWYADNFSRWLCFDLNTKETTVIKENVPIAGNARCVDIGNGMFAAIRKSEDGYSRTLLFFRYDWKNSAEQYISNITPLTDLEGAVSYMGNYMVLFQAQDGFGLCYQEIPDWDPTFSG